MVARIKMRVDDKSSGSLRLFESLEAIALGIHGKLALWLALCAASEIANELGALNMNGSPNARRNSVSV